MLWGEGKHCPWVFSYVEMDLISTSHQLNGMKWRHINDDIWSQRFPDTNSLINPNRSS